MRLDELATARLTGRQAGWLADISFTDPFQNCLTNPENVEFKTSAFMKLEEENGICSIVASYAGFFLPSNKK